MAVSSIWFIQNVVRNGVLVVIDVEQVKVVVGESVRVGIDSVTSIDNKCVSAQNSSVANSCWRVVVVDYFDIFSDIVDDIALVVDLRDNLPCIAKY